MGRYLIPLISKDAQNDVFITTRRKISSDCDNVHYITGNAKDIGFIGEVMKASGKWDVVVDFMIYSLEEFSKRVDLFLENAGQYIFLSSARVYADTKEPITESTPRLLDSTDDEKLLNSNNYAIVKARQEDLLIGHQAKNWTIVRPYITYSDAKLQLGAQEKEEWLYRVIHNRSIIVPDDIMNKTTTMTWGKDVAQAIVSFMGVKAAFGEIVNTAQNASVKWSGILNIYKKCLEELGYKVNTVHIDHAAKLSSNAYKLKYDRLLNRTFSCEKIKAISGFSDFTDNETGIKDCLQTFLKQPSFLGISWLYQAKVDRITKECAKWKEIPSVKDRCRYFLIRYLVPDPWVDRVIGKLR